MKFLTEEQLRKESVIDSAKKIMSAARTAPKARGKDNLVISLVTGDDIIKIADLMKEMVQKDNAPQFYIRDADNIMNAQAMIFLGTKIQTMGLSPCGMCGFKNCEEKEKHPDHPCAFNTGDLGIATGSAVSLAADLRLDNRIMYSVGQAVLKHKLMGAEVKIVYGIPLSVSSKNIFFDRK